MGRRRRQSRHEHQRQNSSERWHTNAPSPRGHAISQAFDQTNGLYKEAPQPKPPAPPEDAIPLPSPDKDSSPSPCRLRINPRWTPIKNAAARQRLKYGKGGNPVIPTGDQSATPGGRPAAGVSVPGQGGGDFATRFGWYIQAAKRRVDPNWDRLSIDPGVRSSTTLHAAVSFDINRDGSIKNVRITQSSGNLSWDNAGLRAIMGSNPLPPLPPDYQGARCFRTWDFPEQRR